MKTTKTKLARVLPLLALLGLAPLALCSCTDAGDEPSGATGPGTVYNPGTDYGDATIEAKASDTNLEAGETFTVVVTYRDADGAVVKDAALGIGSEASYFTTPANPSYTNADGKASFQISIDNDCPSGTYYFAVYTNFADPLDGPMAIGSFGIRVGGGGISSVSLKAIATTVELGVAAPFIATATVTDDCTPVFYYQAGGAGTNTTTWTQTNGGNNNPNFFTVPTSGTTVGAMAVVVRAYCQGNDSAYAESSTVTISISSAAAPTITTPNAVQASTNTSFTNTAVTFTTGGSTCSNGETVQYQFTATGTPNEPNPSSWATGISTNFSWPASGSFTVTAQARCQTTTSVVSAQSGGATVTIQ